MNLAAHPCAALARPDGRVGSFAGAKLLRRQQDCFLKPFIHQFFIDGFLSSGQQRDTFPSRAPAPPLETPWRLGNRWVVPAYPARNSDPHPGAQRRANGIRGILDVRRTATYRDDRTVTRLDPESAPLVTRQMQTCASLLASCPVAGTGSRWWRMSCCGGGCRRNPGCRATPGRPAAPDAEPRRRVATAYRPEGAGGWSGPPHRTPVDCVARHPRNPPPAPRKAILGRVHRRFPESGLRH